MGLRDNKPLAIILVICSVVGLVASIFFTIKPKTEEFTLYDTSNGKVVTLSLAQGTEFPVENENGEKTLFLAQGYKCGGGHTFYVPMVSADGGGGAPVMQEPICDTCGSRNIEILENVK